MGLKEYIEKHKEIIDQLPGFVCVHDLDSKIAFTNHGAASVLGFNSTDHAIGKHYTELNCEASKQAKDFELQDKLVFDKIKNVSFLNYGNYFNCWKLVFGEKSPLKDANGDLIGLISYWTDLTNFRLIDISQFMLNSTNKFLNQNDNAFTYLLEDGFINNYPLSERQIECLFFIIRGKSAREIGDMLNLSPRTVESHLHEIKLKMKCFTKAQLIEKCFTEGLVNTMPKRLLKVIKTRP